MSSLRIKLSVAFMMVVGLTVTTVSLHVDRAVQTDYLHAREAYLLAQANIVANDVRWDLIRHPEQLHMTAAQFGYNLNARVVITDQYGTVIADAFNSPQFIGTPLNVRELKAALRGEQQAGNRLLTNGTWTMYASVPVLYGQRLLGAVLISQSLEDVREAIAANRWRLGGAALLTIIAGATLSLIFASVLSHRIAVLTEAANEIGAGNLSKRVDISGRDEIAILAESFNLMAERLQEAEMQRSRFFTAAAHELRTPVSAIKALAEPLAFGPEQSSDVYQEFCTDIYHQAERLSALVDVLLRVSAFEHAENVKKQEVNFKDIVVEALDQVRPLVAQKNLTISYTPRDIQARLDPDMMLHLCLNLLHNAVKYTPEGGSIALDTEADTQELRLTVTDTGIGIPREHLNRVFERFYRVEQSRSRQQGGSGLGLSIAKQIVDAHGGAISIESDIGAGTTVTVVLPRYQD